MKEKKEKIEISKASFKNIEKIFYFIKSYFKEIENIKLNTLKVRKTIKNNLSNKTHQYFIIKFKNKEVGLIDVYFREKIADLCLIYILPQFRKLGIGKKAIKNVLKILKDKGIRKLLIEISNENKPSFNFFNKNIFKKFKTKIKSFIYEVKLKNLFF